MKNKSFEAIPVNQKQKHQHSPMMSMLVRTLDGPLALALLLYITLPWYTQLSAYFGIRLPPPPPRFG